MRIIFIFVSLLFLSVNLYSNTDNRYWSLADGTKVHAALVSYDSQKKIAYLVNGSGETIEMQLDKLGAVDQAWLKKFQNLQAELASLTKELGGTYKQRIAEGDDYSTNYYVYYPTAYKNNKNLPFLLLFHPGGQGQRFLYRHILAAERAGIVIACPDVFRNSGTAAAKDMEKRFVELHADIEENIEYDKTQFCMGGSSGGALKSYFYAADFINDCFGVYANGGWLGNDYTRKYPAMKVAMVNGHKDSAANNYVETDRQDLEKKGSTVQLFVFEGGHQTAPTETQFKAFLWMFEEKKFYAGLSKDLEDMRSTWKFENDTNVYSAEGVHDIAFKIFSKVDFKGMSKETALAILGNPASLNRFALVPEKDLNSPLVYFFADGEQSSSWILTFKDGKVAEVKQYVSAITETIEKE